MIAYHRYGFNANDHQAPASRLETVQQRLTGSNNIELAELRRLRDVATWVFLINEGRHACDACRYTLQRAAVPGESRYYQ
jgi:hypothetical protein